MENCRATTYLVDRSVDPPFRELKKNNIYNEHEKKKEL